MSPPRVDGVSAAEQHPAMFLWPSFKQMADEAASRRLAGHEEERGRYSCSSSASDDDDDFEFAPVPRDESADASALADIHSPVLDRDFFFRYEEERQESNDAGKPASGPGESEQPPAAEAGRDGADYCLWRSNPRSEPEPEPPMLEAAGKSMSTGGLPARSRPSPTHEDLVAATRRSCSDGAGRFGFLASPTRAAPTAAAGDRPKRGDKKKKVPTEMDMATAHRLFYSKQNQDRGAAGGSAGGHARRSYLPYRKDIVGFFAGGSRFLPF